MTPEKFHPDRATKGEERAAQSASASALEQLKQIARDHREKVDQPEARRPQFRQHIQRAEAYMAKAQSLTDRADRQRTLDLALQELERASRAFIAWRAGRK
jgi:hypothetical protein